MPEGGATSSALRFGSVSYVGGASVSCPGSEGCHLRSSVVVSEAALRGHSLLSPKFISSVIVGGQFHSDRLSFLLCKIGKVKVTPSQGVIRVRGHHPCKI